MSSTDGKAHSGGISLSPSEFTDINQSTTVTVENLSGWACQRSAPVPQQVPAKWAVPDPHGLFRSISRLNATQGTETAPCEGRVALKWLTGQPLGFPGYSLRKWQLFYLEASPTNCPRLLCCPHAAAPHHRLFFRSPGEPRDSITQIAPAAKLLPRAPAAEEQAHSDLRTFVLEC